MRHKALLLLSLLLVFSAGLFAANKSAKSSQRRFVPTQEDMIRLNGWDEFQAEKKKFEQRRRAGLDEFLKERETKERKQEQQRVAFAREEEIRRAQELRQRRAWELAEQGRQTELAVLREKKRQAHLANIERRRKIEGGYVSLSEEEEFGLLSERERFEWQKRQLFGGKKSGSSGTSSGSFDNSFTPPPPGRFDGSPGGAFGEVPNDDFFNTLPPLPETDFFEEIPPPPPPPPMPGMEGFDDGGFVPPPPPPVFDSPQF